MGSRESTGVRCQEAVWAEQQTGKNKEPRRSAILFLSFKDSRRDAWAAAEGYDVLEDQVEAPGEDLHSQMWSG